MTTPHKHAEIIKAWADGEAIEYLDSAKQWCPFTAKYPPYDDTMTYRIKPKRVKKEGWLNLYSAYPAIHTTKEEADFHAESTRKACVRIEWEEEV